MNTKKTTQDSSRVAHIRKKQKEQRRIFLILIAFVLIIFSFGTIFGCFLASAFSSQEACAEEPNEIVEAVHTTAEAQTLLHIESDGRTLDSELQKTMLAMCEKYKVPFALVLAVAEQESHFDPDAVSRTNDYGMMQINQINFEWLQKKGINPLDHKGNIEAGVLMLSQALEKHGETELALMAYNCGDAGAKRLWNKGVYSTKYSSSIMEKLSKWDSYIRGV